MDAVDRIVNKACALNHRIVIASTLELDEARARLYIFEDAYRALGRAHLHLIQDKAKLAIYRANRAYLKLEIEALKAAIHARPSQEDAVFGTNNIAEDPEFVRRFLEAPVDLD